MSELLQALGDQETKDVLELTGKEKSQLVAHIDDDVATHLDVHADDLDKLFGSGSKSDR